jgi:hypothetical protein
MRNDCTAVGQCTCGCSTVADSDTGTENETEAVITLGSALEQRACVCRVAEHTEHAHYFVHISRKHVDFM